MIYSDWRWFTMKYEQRYLRTGAQGVRIVTLELLLSILFFSLCTCILLSDSGEYSHFLKHYDLSGGGWEMLVNGGLQGSCSREAGQNQSACKTFRVVTMRTSQVSQGFFFFKSPVAKGTKQSTYWYE